MRHTVRWRIVQWLVGSLRESPDVSATVVGVGVRD
jgi:hypothetical protein